MKENSRLAVSSLLLISSLAYVVTPYWVIPDSGVLRAVFLIASVAFCFAWSLLSAGPVKLRATASPVLGVLILCAGVALNYSPLTSSIPWRGDEDFHI